MKLTFDPITKAQLNYINILATDLGFNLHRRNAHIRAIIKQPSFIDIGSMSKEEASQVISQFKEWKENGHA